VKTKTIAVLTRMRGQPIPNRLLQYKGVFKSFQTGCLERELQMVQLPLGAVLLQFCESV
jgi:hypothetical protein